MFCIVAMTALNQIAVIHWTAGQLQRVQTPFQLCTENLARRCGAWCVHLPVEAPRNKVHPGTITQAQPHLTTLPHTIPTNQIQLILLVSFSLLVVFNDFVSELYSPLQLHTIHSLCLHPISAQALARHACLIGWLANGEILLRCTQGIVGNLSI